MHTIAHKLRSTCKYRYTMCADGTYAHSRHVHTKQKRVTQGTGIYVQTPHEVIQNSAPYRHCTATSDPPTRDRHIPPTLHSCTYRLTHTSLVSALSPRKLWKAGRLPEFSLLQVVESEPRMQYEWGAGDSEVVVMPACPLQPRGHP